MAKSDKYQGMIIISCTNGSVIERSLAPDNLSNMKMRSTNTTLTIAGSAPGLGTLINTVDDLLMNVKIACDLESDIRKGGAV